MARDVEFAVTGHGQRVHVLSDKEPRSWFGGKVSVAESVGRGVIGATYCGRTVEISRGGEVVHSFPDDALCAVCHRLFPGDKRLLFEHGQGDDTGGAVDG